MRTLDLIGQRILFLILCGMVSVGASSFSRDFEKARYLFEIEGNSKEALELIAHAEANASAIEKERWKLLKIEILYAKGKVKDARKKLGTTVAKSSIPRKHLQTLSSKIGVDTVYQKANLLQLNMSSLDTVMDWQNERYAFYKGGFWAKWGQKPDSNLALSGNIPLFMDGQRVYSMDQSRRVLYVNSLQSGEELLRYELSEPIAWAVNSGDRLLIWSGASVLAFRGVQIEWKWNSTLGWCSPTGNRQDEDIMLICHASQTLVLLDPQKGKWDGFKFNRKTLGALALPQGFVLYDSEGLARVNRKTKSEIWRVKLGQVDQAKILGAHLLAKSKERIWLLEAKSGTVIKSVPLRTQYMEMLNQRLVFWRETGEIAFFDQDLNFLWEYKMGQKLLQAPLTKGEHILVLGENGQTTLLDGLYNGLLPTEQEGLLQKAQQLLDQKQNAQAYQLAQKVLAIEPGNSRAKLFNLESEQKKLNFAELYQVYQQGKEDSNLSNATLQAMSKEEGTQWIADLHHEHTAFPQFRQSNGRIWWVHPENTLSQSLDLRTGQRRSYTGTNSYPGLMQPMDLFDNNFVVAVGRRIDYFSTQGQYLVSSPDLPDAPLWVGAFGKNIVRVGRSGCVSFLDQNGSVHAFLPSLDHSAVIHVQKTRDVLDVFYRSGAWFRALPKTRQWVRRNVHGGVDAVWSTEAMSVLAHTDRTLNAYAFDGSLLWEKELPAQAISIQGDEKRIYLGLSDQRILAFDRNSGEHLWQYQGSGSLFVKPLLVGDQLYLDQGQKIVVLDERTGKLMRQKVYPFRIGGIQSEGSLVLVTSASGLLLAYKMGSL